MKMKGKIAVVTAAGQGIGRATAEGLAKRGAKVYALDNNPDTLKDVTDITPIVVDCTNERAVTAFFETLPRVDILVHGVGYVHHGTIEDCPPEEIASMCIYLASDDSAYATGQCFNIDGGTLI